MEKQEIERLNQELAETRSVIARMESYRTCWEMGDAEDFERHCDDLARLEKILGENAID